MPTTASESCKVWQDALLDFATGCGIVQDAQGFEKDLRAIHCASDSAALDCAAHFETAECLLSSIQGCDAPDMADRAAAEAQCVLLSDAICEKAVACGQYASADEYHAAGGALQLDCATVIGWDYQFDECINGVEALECSATAFPDACTQVFIVG